MDRPFQVGRRGGPGAFVPKSAVVSRWRFFKNDVRIRAAEAKGTNTGKPRLSPRGPSQCPTGHEDRHLFPGDMGIRRVEMQMRGNLLMPKCEYNFHESADPGGRLEVAQVSFHRSHDKWVVWMTRRPEDGVECPNLNWVA